MKETDFLYPNDIVLQCDEAIKNLEKENEHLKVLDDKILAFVEDKILISQKISAAKMHFNKYHFVFKGLIEKNKQDINRYQQVKKEIVDNVYEDLCGDAIFELKFISDKNYEIEKRKAKWYFQQANSAYLRLSNAILCIHLENIANYHREQAAYWLQISSAYKDKMILFDNIESRTATLFSKRNDVTKMDIEKILKNDFEILKVKAPIEQEISSYNSEDILLIYLTNYYSEEIENGQITMEEILGSISIMKNKDPYMFSSIITLHKHSPSDCDKLVKKMIEDYIFINNYITTELFNSLGWAYVSKEHIIELKMVLLKYDITTIERIRHFLAQCHVESGTSDDLIEDGNVEKKSYYPYYGAGRIQLTHDYNYYAFAIYMACEKYPQLKEDIICYNPEHYDFSYIEPQYRKMIEIVQNEGYNIDISEITKIVDEGPRYVASNYAWETAGYFWDINHCNDIVDSFESEEKENADLITNEVNKWTNTYIDRQDAYEMMKRYIK